MKRFGFVTAAIALLFAVGLALSPAQAQEEFPGSWYYGECNGNGIVDAGDMSCLQGTLNGFGVDYSAVVPPIPFVQDMSGDEIMDGGDMSTLQGWLNGNWSNPFLVGLPEVIKDVVIPATLISGSTYQITAKVWDSISSGNATENLRPGWGVYLSVNPASGCTPGQVNLFGLDPTPITLGGKEQYINGAQVFNISGGGHAGLRPTAQGNDVIFELSANGDCNLLVDIWIDSDAGLGYFSQKLDHQVFAQGSPYSITVTPSGSCTPTLAVTPDPAAVNDGQDVQLTATETCGSTITDVTATAAWSVTSGPCSVVAGLVSAPEGCADAVCVVEAIGAATDSATVNVTNDETVAVSQADMVCSPVNDGDAISCSGSNDYAADGCLLGPSACVPACTAGCSSGDITDEGCADSTYDAACGTDVVTGVLVTNDETVAVSQADLVCVAVNDGEAISCSGANDYAADGCLLGPSACVPTCTAGCAVDPITDEGCADSAYTASCGTATSGAAVINDELAVVNTVASCLDVNDGDAINCSGTNYAADGCDLGACTPVCTGGCSVGNVTDEGCADGVYTATCDLFTGGANIINNETVVQTVDISPDGPVGLTDGAIVTVGCVGTYADSCTMDCLASVVDPAGCGSLVGSTYTAAGAPCSENLTASVGVGSDSLTINVTACVLTISPDPAAVNDGNAVQLTATDSCDGDVTALATWSVTSGPCSAGATPGLIDAAEGCADAVCNIQADYAARSNSDASVVNVTNDETAVSYQADLVCVPVNDGNAISCSGTNDYAADGCLLGPSACVPTCTAGCAIDPITDEGCADSTYDAACGMASVSGITVINDELTEASNDLACSDVNDGNAISCVANGFAADGCPLGASSCTLVCTSGCTSGNITDEGCADAAYTADCGTASDGGLVINDETTPTGSAVQAPASVLEGEIITGISVVDTFADGCTAPGSGTVTPSGDCSLQVIPGGTVVLKGPDTFDGGTLQAWAAAGANPPYVYATPPGGFSANAVLFPGIDPATNPPGTTSSISVTLDASALTGVHFTGTACACLTDNGEGLIVAYDCGSGLTDLATYTDTNNNCLCGVGQEDYYAFDFALPAACDNNAAVTLDLRYAGGNGASNERNYADALYAYGTGAGGSDIVASEILCDPTGTCTLSSAGATPADVTVNNDDSVTSVNVAPEGPLTGNSSESVVMTCTQTWSDACALTDCSAALIEVGSCNGSLTGTTYNFGTEALCSEVIEATVGAFTDGETVTTNNICVPSAVIVSGGAAINDGTGSVQLTALDDCGSDLTGSATWSVVSGPCNVVAGLVTAPEGCADDSCVIQASSGGLTPGQDTVPVINDELTEATNDLACVDVNDGSPISCTANGFAADGCPLGPSSCTLSCDSGCSSGLSTPELCVNSAYTASCGTASDGANIINNETTEVSNDLNCSGVNDGDPISCTATAFAADGCNLGPSSCTLSCTSGCVGLNTIEGCADTTYDAACGTATDTAPVTNNETTVAYQADMVCSPVNDGDAINCTASNDYAADDCLLGPSPCTLTCTSGCSSGLITAEGCADSSYIAACGSDGDGAVIINNETVVQSLDIVPVVGPGGSIALGNGATQNFTCTGLYADSCSMNCVSTMSLAPSSGCGTLSVAGLYTAPGSGTCVATVSNTVGSGSDSTTINVGSQPAPVISSVFPLNFSDRFRLNAHNDQPLTVVFAGAPAGIPTSVTASCTGASSVTFTCDLGALPGDLDVPCYPGAALVEKGTYNCTINASNPGGSDVATGSMTTGTAAADAKGGIGGGYLGGGVYDSTAASVGNGTVIITPVDFTDGSTIPGQVYVQILQAGQPMVERYSDAGTGSLTVSLPPLPIDEIHLGYKCGGLTCTKGVAGNYYNDFQFMTWHDVDALDMVLPMELGGGALFLRNRATVTGSIPIANFNTYIKPAASNVRTGNVFLPPVTLRAGIVIPTFPDSSVISSGLDAILYVPDTEISISLCLSNTGGNIDYKLKAALPPNLVAPELVRSAWASPCSTWATNPGYTGYQAFFWTPGEYRVIYSVAAYANAANFTLTGALDIFSFPLTVCAMGWQGITIPAALRTTPQSINLSTNLTWSYDLREMWTNDYARIGATGSARLGYDPDSTVNRKILLAAYGRLPKDPARASAVAGRAINNTVYSGPNLPNTSDAELVTKFGGSTPYGDRFYRKNFIFATGADLGPKSGLMVTGLALNIKIDDVEFTTFMIGFMASTGTQLGNASRMYWTGGGDSEVVSVEHANFNSTWGTNGVITALVGGATIDLTARQNGGATNYATIAAISRGQFADTPMSDRANTGASGLSLALGFQPGSLVMVQHIGPMDSTTAVHQKKIDDYPSMPEATAPAADRYIYPSPQWSSTVGASVTMNRNGELWRDRTVDSSIKLQQDGGSSNRLFVEFNTFNSSLGNRAVRQWGVSMSDSDVLTLSGNTSTNFRGKASAKTPIVSDDGYVPTLGTFRENRPTWPNSGPRFWAQGVRPGDSLIFQDAGLGCSFRRNLITSVNADNQTLTYTPATACGSVTTGAIDVRYRVARANRDGECSIDPWYGGGPTGYGCKNNAFWTAAGPLNGAATVRVHLPAVTSGSRTLGGVPGTVPDFWDGMVINGSTAPYNALEWSYSTIIYNTDDYVRGGLGGQFDWNNQTFRVVDVAQQLTATDTAFTMWQ